MTIFYHSTACKCFTFFMFDCLSEMKIICFEAYLYFSHQPQFSLLLKAASETACWIAESMITVNGNTITIMCLIKLIWADWNLYQKVKECCLVSWNRKPSLLQVDILKFANSLELPCKQIFFGQTICKQFFSSFCLLQTISLSFLVPPR